MRKATTQLPSIELCHL